jgi:hypothetical protein
MGVAPTIKNVTVTLAGTRVALFTSTPTYAAAFYCEALSSNTGSIFLGNSTVASSTYMRKMTAGAGFSINAHPRATEGGPGGGLLDLSQLFIDSDVNAQVLLVSFMPVADKY